MTFIKNYIRNKRIPLQYSAKCFCYYVQTKFVLLLAFFLQICFFTLSKFYDKYYAIFALNDLIYISKVYNLDNPYPSYFSKNISQSRMDI